MRDKQSGHHLPDVAGPPTSDVPVANSGLQIHTYGTFDLLRLWIRSKVNVGLSFLFSLKNMGQCCSSQLLTTTASREMTEK